MYRIHAPTSTSTLPSHAVRSSAGKKKERWTGVVNGAVIRAEQKGNELIIESTLDKKNIQDYFRLMMT